MVDPRAMLILYPRAMLILYPPAGCARRFRIVGSVAVTAARAGWPMACVADGSVGSSATSYGNLKSEQIQCQCSLPQVFKTPRNSTVRNGAVNGILIYSERAISCLDMGNAGLPYPISRSVQNSKHV